MTRKCSHGTVIISGAECKDCTIEYLKKVNADMYQSILEYQQIVGDQNEVIAMYIDRMKNTKINRLLSFTSLKTRAIIKLVSSAKQAIFK
jgi:hypothetical protein